jgi:hypothetical protein
MLAGANIKYHPGIRYTEIQEKPQTCQRICSPDMEKESSENKIMNTRFQSVVVTVITPGSKSMYCSQYHQL